MTPTNGPARLNPTTISHLLTLEVARAFLFLIATYGSYIRREFVAACDIIPQLFAVYRSSQPRCQQKRTAQLPEVQQRRSALIGEIMLCKRTC